MARIEKDTVSYFPHDAKSSTGDTLTILQGRFGNDGYATWFKVLEKLASTDKHYIDLRSPMRWQLFTAYLGLNEITTVEIMELLVEIEAIDADLWRSRVIWCQNLVDNLVSVYKNRRREIPNKPILNNNKPITTKVNPKTTDRNTHSKVEYSIVDKSKGKKDTYTLGEFNNVILTTEEHAKLVAKFGGKKVAALIANLSIGIQSKGYKYKDHYATILNWERRDNGNPAVKGIKPLPDTKTLKEKWKQ